MRAALKTVLVEKGVTGGQVTMSDEVENYPGFTHISGAELSMKFTQHAQSYNLEMISQEVTALDPGSGSPHRQPGQRRVAQGPCGDPGHRRQSAKKLDVPGEREFYGKGVSYCATCDGFFFRGKDGGGGRRW
jgi:thioredoxin reductase (NADPH)